MNGLNFDKSFIHALLTSMSRANHSQPLENYEGSDGLSQKLREIARGHFLKELDAESAKELVNDCARPGFAIHSIADVYRRLLRVVFPALDDRGIALPYYYGDPLGAKRESLIQLGDALVGFVPKKTLLPTRTAYRLGQVAGELIQDRERVSVFEFGVGTGVVGSSLLRTLPEDANYVGGDIDPISVQLAKDSLRWNGFALERAVARAGDGFSVLERAKRLDLIVSNPPYYPSDRAHHKAARWIGPSMALDGGHKGLLFYERIFKEGASRIKAGGWIVVQAPTRLSAQVLELARRHYPASKHLQRKLEPHRKDSDLAIAVQAA